MNQYGQIPCQMYMFSLISCSIGVKCFQVIVGRLHLGLLGLMLQTYSWLGLNWSCYSPPLQKLVAVIEGMWCMPFMVQNGHNVAHVITSYGNHNKDHLICFIKCMWTLSRALPSFNPKNILVHWIGLDQTMDHIWSYRLYITKTSL